MANDGIVWDDEPAQGAAPTTSQAESAMYGGLSGITAGIAPYAGAVGHYLGTNLGGNNVGYSWPQALAESKADYTNAQQANPVTYGASNFVGGLVPGIMSGGETVLGNVGRQAALGGVQSAAGSNTVDDATKNAFYGALESGAGAGVFSGLGKAAQLVTQKYGRSALSDILLDPATKQHFVDQLSPNSSWEDLDDAMATFGYSSQVESIAKQKLAQETSGGSLMFEGNRQAAASFKRVMDMPEQTDEDLLDLGLPQGGGFSAGWANMLKNKEHSSLASDEGIKPHIQDILQKVPDVQQGLLPALGSGAWQGAKSGITSKFEPFAAGAGLLDLLSGHGSLASFGAAALAPPVIGGVLKGAVQGGRNLALKSVVYPSEGFVGNLPRVGGVFGGQVGQVGDRLLNVLNQGTQQSPQPQQSSDGIVWE